MGFAFPICLLFLVYAGLIFVYRRNWKAVPGFEPGTRMPRTMISVLIPARNEEKNISHCLVSLDGQSYPHDRFEVLVLDDHSTDGTVQAVRSFAGDLRLRCIPMADQPAPATTRAFKKFAIDTGVRAAAGELIVATDADCLFEPDWLLTMAAFYEEKNAKFIAAPVRIAAEGRAARGLLGIFQTLDFITLQGITGASVHARMHSMCNGANLAYSAKAFEEAEGFKGIDDIPSGDDLLLMHKIARLHPDKVFYLKSRRTIVTTGPASGWTAFLHQRIRWASKADRYEDKRIFWVLLLVYIVNLMLAVLLAAALFDRRWAWLFLILLVLKTAVEYPFVRDVAGFFGQRRLMVYFPLLQPLHILYTIVVGWLGKFGSYDWKDRKINK
ncbi:MAG TPA: glycosyltransferase [Puia sp.]|nr:glycosyltransferase [Puia sp.]